MPIQLCGPVAIIGSGELSDSMAETHRVLMARLGEPVRPVFIDTPAGFELNIDQIDEKASAYFKRNFGLDLAIARYRSRDDGAEAVAAAIAAIRRANYIFAGPGSPAYGIRNWRDSKVWEAVLARWQEGAMIAFASASAIALGEYAIPVYEIYKCGDTVRWIDGLNMLGQVGLRTAVVPHWNNNSGDQHDTRYCFMGSPRLALLEEQIPADVLMLGVDEYTVLLIDSNTRQAEVFGPGTVTLREAAQQTIHSKGDQFEIQQILRDGQDIPSSDSVPVSDMLSSEEKANESSSDIENIKATVRAAVQANDVNCALEGLMSLSLIAGAGLEQGIYNRAEQAVQALQLLLAQVERLPVLTSAGQPSSSEELDALLDLMVTVRADLRGAKLWAVADKVRDRLTALGFTLADSPDGTTWRRI